MKEIFADTFYFLAFLDRRDAHHQRALDFATSFRGTLVTARWVLAEVAKARAFLTAISELQLEDELLELEHDENFLETLEARIEEFEGADDSQSGAEQAKSGAVASLPTVISRGLTILKGLNAIANKYKSDAAKLGAWKTASHVERTNQKPKAKPAPAPAPSLKSVPAPSFAGPKQMPALAGAR